MKYTGAHKNDCTAYGYPQSSSRSPAAAGRARSVWAGGWASCAPPCSAATPSPHSVASGGQPRSGRIAGTVPTAAGYTASAQALLSSGHT